ncbi:potassium channel family protein [Methanobacterium sp.]|uniref:potassium channel family protein n=1 Tax=Methanobacterium sp. TaxID=2164 RepID=UPI002ABA158B|nr:ion channel [Methanobacterium sp.]MDY9922838.1 ion channel [Methanobacterium sp.]
MKEKINLIIEGIILVLILSDVIMLTSLFFIQVSPQVYTLIVYFDLFVVLILIPEFIYRFWKSDDKKQFLWENWTDIIGMIPEILVGPISSVFRYFRFIRIIKIFGLFKNQIMHFYDFIHKSKLDYGVLIILIVMISCATALFFVEFGINDKINTFDDAFWFLMATVTTVGYGDVYPSTETGRIISVILMFTGIGFMSFLTATITSKFVKNTRIEDKLSETHEKLDKLQSEINELKEIIKKNKK